MNVEDGIRTINHIANQVHMKYIPSGLGLALTFQEKADEAADYIAAGYPKKLDAWPFINAEKNATGLSAKSAADAIIKAKSDWVALAAKIEEVRVSTIKKLSKNNAKVDVHVKRAIDSLEKL